MLPRQEGDPLEETLSTVYNTEIPLAVVDGASRMTSLQCDRSPW